MHTALATGEREAIYIFAVPYVHTQPCNGASRAETKLQHFSFSRHLFVSDLKVLMTEYLRSVIPVYTLSLMNENSTSFAEPPPFPLRERRPISNISHGGCRFIFSFIQ